MVQIRLEGRLEKVRGAGLSLNPQTLPDGIEIKSECGRGYSVRPRVVRAEERYTCWDSATRERALVLLYHELMGNCVNRGCVPNSEISPVEMSWWFSRSHQKFACLYPSTIRYSLNIWCNFWQIFGSWVKVVENWM